MDTYFRFLFEFLSVFFNGVGIVFSGLFKGFREMFDFNKYMFVIHYYQKELKGGEWVLTVIAVVALLIILAIICLFVFVIVKRILKLKKNSLDQEAMLDEIASLQKEVSVLMQEKQKILGMKVPKLGEKMASITNDKDEIEVLDEENKKEEDLAKVDSRFSKLHAIDVEYQNYKIQKYNNTFTLEELVELFRNYAASKLKLYYTTEMIRLFISALSATKLVILQGISGTVKTSLAYAWGKFIKQDAIIASVQPSWRDRTELFGYFNEFTKKFNETEVLRAMYKAGYTDDLYVTVLDEMNIARVEYYFAEMLSILEMPSRDEWLIELVPSVWDTDPKMLQQGKLKIPGNMWYIGTINNDDSTFAVTDKVYDRAMPIDINDKGQVFDPIETEAMNINDTYLESLFKKAKENHPLTDEMTKKIDEMDDYVIKHFRIAFGNRIVKQLKDFVATYVECGGREVDGVDYYIARKILRKFEQLNLAYIRDEIDGFISFLDKEFGKENFKECKEYLLRLKKMV